MTLIIALLNRDQAVLVSDRRVTENGRLVDTQDNERNKAGVLVTRDARVAFAFTGLARFQSFNTELWLLETLAKCAAPEFMMGPLIDRFARRAEQDIGVLSSNPRDKRLTVLLGGYCNEGDAPRGYLWRVSNFEGGPGDELSETASAAFTTAYWRDKQDPADSSCIGALAGWTTAVQKRHTESLHVLVPDRKPARAIVGKAVDVLRDVARLPESRKMISEQCTSIVLPSNPRADASAEYHAGAVTDTLGGIAYVEATGGARGTFVVKTESVAFRDSAGAPLLVVPKVGPNKPCPCGRGRTYKNCHGRAHRNDATFHVSGGDP